MSLLLRRHGGWSRLLGNRTCHRRYSAVAAASAEVHVPATSQARGAEHAPSFLREATNGRDWQHWKQIVDQPLSKQSLYDLLSNKIPAIRVKQFLSEDECKGMTDVVSSHKTGSYSEDVYPPIGSVGITQFGFKQDKAGYFAAAAEARSLQHRFAQEASVPIVERVRAALEQVAGIPVELATEGDKQYFAGLLRVINGSALIHSDYAPYDPPLWKIGQIVSQISWNVLLTQVDGGETVIYNRQWQGKEDDEKFQKPAPSYGYQPIIVQNREFKVMTAIKGDLILMKSRNFHEVRPLDRPRSSRGTQSARL